MKLKTMSKVGAAFVALFAISSAAQAAYINGSINFSGVATLDNVPATATSVTFTNPVTVDLTSGDYAGLEVAPGTATFYNFAFGAVGTTGPNAVAPLWVVAGGWNFNLTAITLNAMSGTQRNLEGIGFANGPGFSSTPGFWTLSTSGTASKVTFSSFTNAVPDGGTTVGLLGLALVGLHGARRKFAKS